MARVLPMARCAARPPSPSPGSRCRCAALFAEPKNIIAYRGLAAALRRRDARRAGSLLPLWLPTYLIFAGLAVAFAIALGGKQWPAIDLWADAPFGLSSVGRFAPVSTTVLATALFV